MRFNLALRLHVSYQVLKRGNNFHSGFLVLVSLPVGGLWPGSLYGCGVLTRYALVVQRVCCQHYERVVR
jgi:hypothetical protein